MEDKDLFKLAKTAPLDAAKECHLRLLCAEQGYHKGLYLCVAWAYAVAYALIRDANSWREFSRDYYWEKFKKRPHPMNPKRPLLNVMVYIFDGACKNAYSRAQKYAAAVLKPFNDGVRPEDIVALIEKKGGLEAMARAAAAERRVDREIKFEEGLERLRDYTKDIKTADENDDDDEINELAQDEEDELNETELSDDDAETSAVNDDVQQDESNDAQDQEGCDAQDDENDDFDRLPSGGWGDLKSVKKLYPVTFWVSKKYQSRLAKVGYGHKAEIVVVRLGDSKKIAKGRQEEIAGEVLSIKPIQ
jgi:hypothetical protein